MDFLSIMRNPIIKYAQQVGWFISGLVFILIPVFSSQKSQIEEGNYCILILVVVMALPQVFTFSKILLRFTLSDVLMLCTAIWIFFDTFMLNERLVSDERIALWMALFVVYAVGRLQSYFPGYGWLFISLALAGGVQAFIAWMQYAGLWESNHPKFLVTGSFLNPAPLGGLLGISLYACGRILQNLWDRKKVFLFALGAFLSFAIGSMFIISFSRASWLALLLSVIMFFWQHKQFKYSRKINYTLIILCIISIIPLYHLKKGSADGRLFIWTVGIEMLKQSPFTGNGASSFAANYMPSQAAYLAERPNSDYAINATVNIYAFNEFLRIACEYGFIGLLLVTILLICALCTRGADLYIKSIFFYLCIYSFLSYTSEVPSLFILFVFLLGFLSGKVFKPRLLCKNKLVCSIYLLSGLLIISISLYRYKEVSEISKLLWCYAGEPTDTLRMQLESYTHKHSYNRTYILGYARQLYQKKYYKEALPYLRQAALLSPTPEIYMDLGNTLLYLHQYQEARKYFSISINMIPGYILPRYYLFRLYVDTGDEVRACTFGKEIIQKKYKQEGTVAMKAKYYIREYLQEKSCIIP